MENTIKTFLYPFFILVMGVLSPTFTTLACVAFLGVIAMLVGYRSGKKFNKESFNPVKAFRFFEELAVILAIIALMAIIGKLMKVDLKVIEVSARTVGWIAIWYYAKIILKNTRRFYPTTIVFRVLENFIDLEFLNINKHLKKFVVQKCKVDKRKYCDDCGKCVDYGEDK